jgi:Fe-S-cluster containining protein
VDSLEFVSPDRIKEFSSSKKQENKLLFKRLKKLPSEKIDSLFNTSHHEAFEQFDCLTCANCCKTISPIITNRDVDRLAKGLGIKPSAVVEKYLTIDSDGDYVFTSAPCPFLQTDNYCEVYEHRPKACREYPHTDRRKMQQIFNITLKNIEVCPVVLNVVEQIKKQVNR